MDNLDKYSKKLRIKNVDSKRFIWDIIRKKWLVLQPEEFVRQIMVNYLLDQGYPLGKITIERSLENTYKKGRYDLLVFDRNLKPFLLIECKSFDEKVHSNIDIQIGSYNTILHSPFICITNGVTTNYYKKNNLSNRYEKIQELPVYPV